MRIVGSPQAWEEFKRLEEQVIADQFSEALETGTVAEGVDLALKFSLTPEQTQKICGSIVGQKERIAECQKFVQNWLMHSSVAELTAYLGKPA